MLLRPRRERCFLLHFPAGGAWPVLGPWRPVRSLPSLLEYDGRGNGSTNPRSTSITRRQHPLRSRGSPSLLRRLRSATPTSRPSCRPSSVTRSKPSRFTLAIFSLTRYPSVRVSRRDLTTRGGEKANMLSLFSTP